MEDGAVTNVIALGDSDFEIEAANILGKQFKKAFIKTVKFRQMPNLVELNNQLKLVNKQFDHIYNQAKSIAISLLKAKEYKKIKEE